MSRPPLTLALGPAGSGKTEWALARFLDEPGRPLLVVPSPQQAATCLRALQARSSLAESDFADFVFPFRHLASIIHASAPEEGYRAISSTFQRLILAELVPQTLKSDDYLGRMRDTPGFVTLLAERLREWKLAGITPDLLEVGACEAFAPDESPSSLRKTRELARLFRAYETFLARYRFRDAEDSLRLAAEHVASGLAPLPHHASLLLIDGFTWFNRTQRQMLAALARREGCEVAVTLPADSARPLLFAAPDRALAALRAEFATTEIVLPARAESRPRTLALLERRLFATQPEADDRSLLSLSAACDAGLEARQRTSPRQGTSPCPTAASEGRLRGLDPNVDRVNASESVLQVFDAPNPYVEAEMVARAFRRLYDAGGCRWNDFGIILRTPGDYTAILSAVFERYGIPFGVDSPEPLTENPLVRTILHLLAIVRYGWQREDVLAFLKSSYTASDRLAADALRRRARAAGVRAGREGWLRLVEHETHAPGSIGDILRGIARHEAALTAEDALPIERADGLRACLNAFDLDSRIAQDEPARASRDHAALEAARTALDALTEMAAFADRPMRTFAEFHDLLLSVWRTTTSMAAPEGDVVRVMAPYDTRERPLRFAAVMGLTERVFPRRIMEDPFLRDEERLLLRERAGLELEAQKNRTDDERFFFYLAVTAPSERLVLSFPRSADEADTLPSFYLDEVREALPEVEIVPRTLADVVPRPEEAVVENDVLLAACADLFDPGAEDERPTTDEEVGSRKTEDGRKTPNTEHRIPNTEIKNQKSKIENLTPSLTREQAAAALLMPFLAREDAQAEAIRATLASRREPRLPRLHDPILREDFAGQKALYSVSELEAYGRCPFQYLLRHVLRLRPDEDDAAPRAQGTLLHAVLRRYFRRQKERRHPLPDRATLRGELRDLLAETLEAANLDASAHRLRMTRRMLTDALEGFAERETRFGPQFQMTPTHFELAFGLKTAGAAALEDEVRGTDLLGSDGPHLAECDPDSCPEPLPLYGTDGGPPVYVCGTLDRVDFDATGRRALVLDYKLGKPPEFSDIQQGRSLQMPLYLLAIERLWGKVGAVGCYDSMREAGRRRFHRTEHVNMRAFAPLLPIDNTQTIKPLNREQYDDLTRTAEQTAVRLARAIATANIRAVPGDHCKFCPYNDVCRTSVIGGHDGEDSSQPDVFSGE